MLVVEVVEVFHQIVQVQDLEVQLELVVEELVVEQLVVIALLIREERDLQILAVVEVV
tara:strand:- start:11 stop:184 length:174 start_codon:yes stop_codon:yes gene_type:complete